MGNKVLELDHFECFKKCCPVFPSGEVTHLDNGQDPPDFIVETAEGRLGIEHTEYVRPIPPGRHSLQGQEERRKRIMNKAQKLYEMTGMPVVHVTAHWMKKLELRNHDEQTFANQIASIVKQNLPAEGQHISLDRGVSNVVLPLDMAFLYIWRPAHARSFFCCDDWGWIPKLQIEEIQTKINEKANKLMAARHKVDELWLLIVTDGGTPSRWGEPSDSLKQHGFVFQCDRAFILQRIKQSCFELSKSANG
jgi:hypothetical protein